MGSNPETGYHQSGFQTRESRTNLEAEVADLRSSVLKLTDLLTDNAQSVKILARDLHTVTEIVKDLVLSDEARRVRIGLVECAEEGMIKGRIKRQREGGCND